MIDMILQPWPWYIAGPLITLVMLLLLWFGQNFGMSSNFRTMCTIGGAGKVSDFFNFDWKAQSWNLTIAIGTLIGGFLASHFLTSDGSVTLSSSTQTALNDLGFDNIGSHYLPERLFGIEALTSFSGVLYLIVGGGLVGFGARYAGGCTSGHAISGLSNLQVPSLIAVIGFFIGGLVMVHILMPLIF